MITYVLLDLFLEITLILFSFKELSGNLKNTLLFNYFRVLDVCILIIVFTQVSTL